MSVVTSQSIQHLSSFSHAVWHSQLATAITTKPTQKIISPNESLSRISASFPPDVT
jgi:hypothetical protein